MPTAFPVKDNAIRINLSNLSYQFPVSIVCELPIKSFGDFIDRGARALIYQNFGSFFGFLLNWWKKVIISPIFFKGHNDSNSLFFVIIKFTIKFSNTMSVASIIALIGNILLLIHIVVAVKVKVLVLIAISLAKFVTHSLFISYSNNVETPLVVDSAFNYINLW